MPQRQPVYTARRVVDLDYLSGRRVDFGIDIGWLEEEFIALSDGWYGLDLEPVRLRARLAHLDGLRGRSADRTACDPSASLKLRF